MSSRARKVGDQFDIERKLEKRYDESEELGTPKAAVDWVSKTLAGECEACAGTGWQDIVNWLKDGVVLCKFVNKLLQSAGKSPVSFQAKAKSSFAAMSNVENFNKGAQEYGLPAASTFQTVDLTDGRKGPFVNVIDCLSNLGFKANANGFNPKYEAPAPPKAEY